MARNRQRTSEKEKVNATGAALAVSQMGAEVRRVS